MIKEPKTPPLRVTGDIIIKALVWLLTKKGIIDGEEWKAAIRMVQSIDKTRAQND